MNQEVSAVFAPSRRTVQLHAAAAFSGAATLVAATRMTYVASKSIQPPVTSPTAFDRSKALTSLEVLGAVTVLGLLAVPVSAYFDRRTLPFPYRASANRLERLGVELTNLGEKISWARVLRRSRTCGLGGLAVRSVMAGERRLVKIVARSNTCLQEVGIEVKLVPSRWHTSRHRYAALMEFVGLWPKFCKKAGTLEFTITDPAKLLRALRAIVVPPQPVYQREPRRFIHFIAALIDPRSIDDQRSVLDDCTVFGNPRRVVFPQAEQFRSLIVQELQRIQTDLCCHE